MDGKKRDSETFGSVFISTYLTEGTHEFELRYKSPGFLTGAVISAAAVVLFAATMAVRRKRKKRMKFDFTTIMDRKGKDALAVDKIPYKDVQVQEGFSVLPMWVADMNFATVPSVQKAMTDRIAHPAFGYFEPREEYFDAIIRWHAKRNGVQGLTRECIGYENRVLGGVLSALNVFCSRGDKVLVHSPTYIGFTFSLKNNGYEIVHSPLVLDENGVWRMDYEDMEKKSARTTFMRQFSAPRTIRAAGCGALGDRACHGNL